MIHDPKAIMVAAAFLASKVEDCTADIRYLEEGTAAMNAAVLAPEIIQSEVVLIAGVHFDLLCFHPFKSVLALTEDLRTFGKTQAGSFPNLPDLKTMYDSARRILDDVIVSDIPLLFTPGQIGLACLDAAASDAATNALTSNSQDETDKNNPEQTSSSIMMTYIELRFPNTSAEQIQSSSSSNSFPHDILRSITQKLKIMLSELADGKHGCGNYHTDLVQLKAIHKKLKKVRAWGRGSSQKNTNPTTTKKRDAAAVTNAAVAEPENPSNETSEKSPKRIKIDTSSS
jgi:cyclin H